VKIVLIFCGVILALSLVWTIHVVRESNAAIASEPAEQDVKFAGDFPASRGIVSDFAGIMESEDVRSIEVLAAALEQKTGAELAVVTVQTFAPYGSIEEYATSLFNSWGLGQAGQDNGVLLILAREERKVKIETGYGLEGAIPDSMAGRILDNAVLPLLKKDNFSGGLLQGAQAIAAVVAKDKGLSAEEIEQIGVPSSAVAALKKSNVFLPIFLPLAAIIMIMLISIPLAKKFGGGRRSRSGGGDSRSHRSSSWGSSRRSGGGRSGGGGASRGF
jgi:uncharacterized protein